MTSGPAPTGALSPDPQPDPQPLRVYPQGWAMDYAVTGDEADGTARVAIAALSRDAVAEDAEEAERATGAPMEVFHDGEYWCYRPARTPVTPADIPEEVHALAVPGPLFDTPQVTTDTAGHWCEGREYVAVDVNGEVDYQPKGGVAETATQPDPQVVAWMRAYLRERPDTRHGDAVHAYRRTHGVYQPPAWDALYAAEDAARKPLTVADIPAGQGAASLFLMPDSYGDLGVWYRAEGGPGAGLVAVIRGEGIEGPDALIAHLRATLPTVTTEESP